MIDIQANGDQMAKRPTRMPRRRRAARALVGANAVIAIVILAGWIPGPVGSAVSVMLPFLGILAIAVALTTLAVVPRAAIAASAAVLVWVVAIAPALPALPGPSSPTSVTIVSQNVQARSGGSGESAAELMAGHPDVITLTELDWDSREAADRVLAESYEYSYAVGTVGIWSVHPLVGGEALDLGLGWARALHVTVQSPTGDTSIYLIHAASLRPGVQTARDEMLTELAKVVRGDASPRVIALGDFNAATTDPALHNLDAVLNLVRPTGGLTGFTWPATFPLVKIDHVFQRGFEVITATTRHAGLSDHLATLTTLAAL